MAGDPARSVRWPRSVATRAPTLFALMAAGTAAALALAASEAGGAALLAAHALLPLLGLWLLARSAAPRARRGIGVAAAVMLLSGAALYLPGDRNGAAWTWAHVAISAGALGAAALAAGRGRERAAAAASAALLLVAYGGIRWQRETWEPPAYDAEAVYRFLTATTAEQSGEPAFPTALRIRDPGGGCAARGCHASAWPALAADPHSRSGDSSTYLAALADFERRRGSDAARWCTGCHDPARLSHRPRPDSRCGACHAARDVHSLYGSAPLVVGPAPAPWEIRLRPRAHASSALRERFHRSPEFCAGCHRKNWSLPQNRFAWMPGPDEYGDWLASRFAGSAFYSPGLPAEPRSCAGCHTIHSGRAGGEGRASRARPVGAAPSLRLDLFLRRAATSAPGALAREAGPMERSAPPRPAEEILLDVVVRNEGIGHDFPTGMPDLQESWVELTVRDARGGIVARSGFRSRDGGVDPQAHYYRLIALDANGRPVRHGRLDEMASVLEWRRVRSGEADLARYRMLAPPAGLGSVEAALHRRRLRERRGEPGTEGSVETIARAAAAPGTAAAGSGAAEAARWRWYGLALARAKSYPQALRALHQALQLAPGDTETLLALGRVYLDEEGDLLAARGAFLRAAAADPDRARAWEGAALRRMGQPAEAAGLLEPLRRRFPRDRRLRFELGLAYLAQLRNREAAREFQAMLDVDPLDVAAHYNLMLCWQRLNRLTDARTEEAIYRLLAGVDRPARASTALESRPLHEHVLEPRR